MCASCNLALLEKILSRYVSYQCCIIIYLIKYFCEVCQSLSLVIFLISEEIVQRYLILMCFPSFLQNATELVHNPGKNFLLFFKFKFSFVAIIENSLLAGIVPILISLYSYIKLSSYNKIIGSHQKIIKKKKYLPFQQIYYLG